ncbi:MAG: cytidylate kinase-like family protein [Verrucomicrobia bacterium]|nr:cytidylate kinase-like family protein [Verrucomicrobiota bacterium]MBV8273646.1 cytidylate kinase-like family protein [Verrucomicrobiota bacterium]
MRVSSLEKFNRYLQLQATIQGKVPLRQQPSITISRESGAGATTVAHMVADQLNAIVKPVETEAAWTVFDKNLAREVLVEHKLPLDLEKFMVEDALLPVESIVEELLGLHPNTEWLAQQTTKTILRLASMGRVVMVGRGAEVITQLLPYVFHVRLVAPLSKRVNQEAEFYGLSPNEAAMKVSEEDQARHRYLRRYFGADNDNPLLYHLVINTAKTGFADAAEIIVQATLKHYREYLHARA